MSMSAGHEQHRAYRDQRLDDIYIHKPVENKRPTSGILNIAEIRKSIEHKVACKDEQQV
jgi:hypothetical protein